MAHIKQHSHNTEMYQLMYEMKKAGKSIILISEELSELIGMSDRVLMMKDGKVTAERLRVDGLSEHDLINYMKSYI